MTTAKKQLSDLIQKGAQTVAQEPFEVLKTGAKQISGIETAYSREPTPVGEERKLSQESRRLEEEDKVRSQRLIEALKRELADIAEQKRQKEAVRAQEEKKEEPKPKKPLIEPSTKRPRGSWIFGPRQKAESLKTRVERPVQSST